MWFIVTLAIIQSSLFCFGQNSSLPDYLSPCKAGPQLDECVVHNGQAAIHKLIHDNDDDSTSDSIELKSLEVDDDDESDSDYGSDYSDSYNAASYESDEALSDESRRDLDSLQDDDSEYDDTVSDSKKKGEKKKKKKKRKPLKIKRIKNGLNINLKGFKLSGLKAIKFSSSKTNLQKKEAEWVFSISKLEIKCKYKITGKALFVPVKASGQAKITMTGVKLTYVFNWSKSKRRGVNVLKLGKSRMRYTVKKVQIQLSNLQANQILAKQAADQVENDVQTTVDDDLGPKLTDSFKVFVTSKIEDITEDVPYEQIFVE